MTAAPLQILLVEDDDLFRLGLATRLQQEPDLEVTAEAGDGETCLHLATDYAFNIVLLDVGLPGIGGMETCRQLKHQHPHLPILVLTSHSQKSLIAQLIEAGAHGYCQKGTPTDALILALRSVAAGVSWWDSTATAEIRSLFQQGKHFPPSESPLTQREREILALVAAGKSNQEIAQALYIAAGTVRVHVRAILHKLGVRDRTQAAVVAFQKQWITHSSSS